jgi:hypothetical protein
MQEATMVFKPNYNHQRAERDRAKAAKKEAKLRDRQDARRAEGQPGDASEPSDAPVASDEPQGAA